MAPADPPETARPRLAALADGAGWRRAGVAGVVAVPLLLVAALGQGNSPLQVAMSSGAAWVASPAVGVVSLVDGPSGVVAAAVAVPATTAPLTVEQAGGSAYVVDATAGTVVRVDGASWEASAPIAHGVPDGELAVLHGGGRVYVLDSTRRTVTLVDPTTLASIRTAPLGSAPGPGEAVVDARGRLWVVDREAGALSRFDGDLRVERDVVDAGDRLVLVDGRPALVDATEGSVRAVTDDGPGRAACLRVRDDDDVRLAPSSTGGLVIAAIPATGTLVWGSVERDDCAHVVSLVDPGTAVDLGTPVHREGWALVPNRATGETIAVDLREGAVARLPLTPPGHRLELVTQGRLVFWNDLDGHTTGVLRFEDGAWVAGDPIDKYDPRTREATAQVRTDGDEPTPDGGTSDAPTGDDADEPTPGTRPDTAPTPRPGAATGRPGGTPARPGGDGPAPGRDPTPRPSAGPTSGPAAPVVDRLVPDVEPVPAGTTLTVTAEARNTTGATWTWTVTGAEEWEGDGEQVVVQVPETATGTVDVRVVVRTAAGQATAERAVEVRPLASVAATCVPAVAGLGQPVVCTGTVDGASAGTWTWTTSGPGGDETHELAAGEPLTWVAGDTPGTYAVTLVADAGPPVVQAQTAGSIADLCTILPDTGPLDVRSKVTRGTLYPRFEGCWIEAHATPVATLPSWITQVWAGITLYGDEGGTGQATIDFQRAGTPPRDGLIEDAVTLTLPNGRTAVHDALGNRPPYVEASYACEVQGTDARFVVKAEDADIPSLTATFTIGSYTTAMEPFTHGSAGWFQAIVPRADLPPGVTFWTATVRDAYDEASAGNSRGSC